jgi:predicted NBD/HSP70 family sugar kinase
MQMIGVFDLGGTFVKYGVMDGATDELVFKDSFKTPNQEGGIPIVEAIIKRIEELKRRYPLKGIAVSSGGVIDAQKGIVINATKTIPGFIGLRIKPMIEEKTGLFTTVDNDVKCFARAELSKRPTVKHFMMITVGTGIGGAAVINHQIYRGATFAGGEAGRMITNGRPWEEIASTTALVRRAQAQDIQIDNGLELFRLYDKHDAKVSILINEWYHDLALGITNLIYLFNPEEFIIGGAVSTRSSFLDELMPHLKETCNPIYLSNTRLSVALYQNDGGMYGAYFHFKDQSDLNQSRGI